MFLRALYAGYIATLVIHQGLVWVLYRIGTFGRAPWHMAPGNWGRTANDADDDVLNASRHSPWMNFASETLYPIATA